MTKIKEGESMRQLTEEDVEFTILCEPEDIPIIGNVLASGDDKADAKAERLVQKRLDSGNQWAWCYVRVIATWNGISGFDSLGGCSYKSEGDFKKGGYYQDMKVEALHDLNKKLEEISQKISQLT